MARHFNLRLFIKRWAAYEEQDGVFAPKHKEQEDPATRAWYDIQEAAVVACSELSGLLTARGLMDEEGNLTEEGKRVLYP